MAMTLGLDYLNSLLEEDKDKGIFRCKREMFTDPRLFDLEMQHIFEGNWLYLAHESQIPKVNDYYTTHMGRQPIFIARNKEGELNAFINACSHRGAMLCRFKSGNKASYTCPFHGWTFNNSGKLLKVKDPKEAGYPDSFNCDGSHDLKKVARFESYRGFLFGSLREDVAPLEDFLGESKKIIDMICDQSSEGLEVLRGSSTYVYEGNWKLQAENGADGVALARQEKPDAVLMDIVMPGLNGFQATRQLTKDAETSHIPVIIVTTKDQETDKVWGKRQGAKD
jgi:benzoate/toluate 1,2-dioxygenase alpha subunit